MNKQELRIKYKSIRNALPPKLRSQQSEDICDKIKNMPQYTAANVIAGYYPIRSEVDVKNVLLDVLDRGKTLVLPICMPNGDIEFRKIITMENLTQGTFGIMEPSDSSEAISFQTIDFMLVPGLVFDLLGYRIGYGKGYYDKALIKVRSDCMTCGIAFSQQLIQSIKIERYDVPVKKVIYNTLHEVNNEKK